MLCSNGHNNAPSAAYCSTCGVNTFQPVSSYGAPAVAHAGTNGYAVASLVLGIVWIFWLGSALALIFGFVAKRQIREHPQGGAGMATAGIVLGCIGAATFLLAMFTGGFHFYWHTGCVPNSFGACS